MLAELHFMGAAHVVANGVYVGLRSKSVALLAYLAVSNTAVSRAALAALLWPDSPQSGVNLRKSIWDIKRALGETALIQVDGFRALRLGDEPVVGCDVRHFADLWRASTQHAHLDPVHATCLH